MQWGGQGPPWDRAGTQADTTAENEAPVDVEDEEHQSADSSRDKQHHGALVELPPQQQGFTVSPWGERQLAGLSYEGRHAELGVEAETRQRER